MAQINTRTQQKNDKETNWSKAINFIPLLGEIILYNETKTINDKKVLVVGNNLKIGDGINKINELPFILPFLENGSGEYALQQRGCRAVGRYSVALGTETEAAALGAVAMGTNTQAYGERSLAMGFNAFATENYSVALGNCVNALGKGSFAQGIHSNAQRNCAVSCGEGTIALGKQRIFGQYNLIDSGKIEPNSWNSSLIYSLSDIIKHNNVYYISLINDNRSIEPGTNPEAWVEQPQGYYRGEWSATKVYQGWQIVSYNDIYYRSRTNNNIGNQPSLEDDIYWTSSAAEKYIDIVGNGTADTKRSNAYTLSTDGDGWFAGSLYVGGRNQLEGKKIATEQYVNEYIAEIPLIYVQDEEPINVSVGSIWIDTGNDPAFLEAETIEFPTEEE